jgi:hypothetical protein
VQTKPNDKDANTNACTGADGYTFNNISTDQSGQDFAFTGGVSPPSCTQDGSGQYFESQLSASGANAVDRAKFYSVDSSCKVANQQFVFTTYTDGSTRIAKLAPVNTLAGDCLPSGVGCQIVAERITWSLAGDSPELKTLSYDDTAQGGSSGVMKFCKKDPFDRSGVDNDGVTLFTGSGFLPGDILPSGASSCLARTGPPGDAKRVDETYSAYDGTKGLS